MVTSQHWQSRAKAAEAANSGLTAEIAGHLAVPQKRQQKGSCAWRLGGVRLGAGTPGLESG